MPWKSESAQYCVACNPGLNGFGPTSDIPKSRMPHDLGYLVAGLITQNLSQIPIDSDKQIVGKITEGMIHVTYAVAKDVHEGRISQKGGLDFLESELGMNRKSALVYLHNYKCMVEGRFFSRVMSAYGIRYFLESIYEDSSRSGLLKALNAFREHLDYHELVVGSNVVERRKLYDEFWCLAELRAGEETSYPDEVDSREALLEGHVKQVTVNVYERNAAARVKETLIYSSVASGVAAAS